MQRPRRTSELHDDPSVIRRQSRIQQKATPAPSPAIGTGKIVTCSSSTIKKCGLRPSRIAVPSRPSSSDRSLNSHLSVPASSQRGVTPQKTPLPKKTANRVLFTAEKQRPAQVASSNAVALHNDKKWVQEQTHRITEHLLSQSTLGGGDRMDFLQRGLRQISIKQFVAIINYFLRYIWGNRFIVGTNHVEDITNILQKLHYPHPINKSWLKTPNTQHSFGNVIVLLDFLMDFVPSSREMEGNFMHFDLKKPEDLNTSRRNEDIFQVPDLEFQQELLSNSEKGFMLWDKQKNEEFSSLKQHTCNLLIQKQSGLSDLRAMEMEIEKMQEILKSLENERPPEDREMQKMKLKLTRDLKKMLSKIEELQDNYDANQRAIKEQALRKVGTSKEVDSLEKYIEELKATLNTQPCTIDQRDQMIENVMQHKQMLAIKERAVHDLQNRYHNEQILQSKAMKQLNDQIESFNAHMREIKFSDFTKIDNNTSLSEDDLELSLRPKKTDLDRLVPQLEQIKKRALESIQENKLKLLQVREHIKQITGDMDEKLYPKLNVLRRENDNSVAYMQKLVQSLKEKECKLLEKMQKVDEDLLTTEANINELQSLIKNKNIMVAELVEANEQTMQHAEQKHQQRLEQKKAFRKAYEELVEECIKNDLLQKLTKQVEQQGKLLEEFRKEFTN